MRRVLGTQTLGRATNLIDVCAVTDAQCKRFAAESGLPLGALGALAAQHSIEGDFEAISSRRVIGDFHTAGGIDAVSAMNDVDFVIADGQAI
jgi:hypothetical protein